MRQIVVQLAEIFVHLGIIEEDKKGNYIRHRISNYKSIIIGIVGVVTRKPAGRKIL